MATVSIYKSGVSVMKGKPHLTFDVADFISGSVQPNPQGGYCLVLVIAGRKNAYFPYKDPAKIKKYAQILDSGISKAKAGVNVNIPFFN